MKNINNCSPSANRFGLLGQACRLGLVPQSGKGLSRIGLISLLGFGILLIGLGLMSSDANAQSLNEIKSQVREYRQANEQKIIKEYFNILSIPNDAADKVNIRKNAETIRDYMIKRGVDARLIETEGNPIVYGEILVPGAETTLMFYEHYDGQPTDDSKWIDHNAFDPVLRPGKLNQATGLPKPIPLPKGNEKYQDDWRIYGRSVSDDKAPVIGLMTALEALKANGIKLKSNIKFIFEGEEEKSSPSLKGFAEKHRELLKCDVLFLCDGPLHFTNKPTMDFGVRGVTGLQMTLYGPNTSVHSGHYGNWMPNPARRLATLISTMFDDDGNVLIDGFYDSTTPLTAAEKKAIDELTSKDAEVLRNYEVAKADGGGKKLVELLQRPALNIKGLQSNWVGEQTRNAIPATATAAIGIRLVKGNDPEDMRQTVIDHVKKQGYHVVTEDPDNATRLKYSHIAKITGSGGYPAAKTSMDTPIVKNIVNRFKKFYDNDVEIIPSLGGSLPLYIFTDILKLNIVLVPIANYDNNQHQPNEDMRIGNFWQGIETYAMLLTFDGKK